MLLLNSRFKRPLLDQTERQALAILAVNRHWPTIHNV